MALRKRDSRYRCAREGEEEKGKVFNIYPFTDFFQLREGKRREDETFEDDKHEYEEGRLRQIKSEHNLLAPLFTEGYSRH